MGWWRAACAWALAAASSATAANVVYNVNSYVGAHGHLTGLLVTDGATGTLNAGNFVSWILNVQGNGASDALNNNNSSVFLGGVSVTANASNIYFNFGNSTPSYLLFQKIYSSGNNYACYASTIYPTTPCNQGFSLVPQSVGDASAQFSMPSGNQIIASVAAAPEPVTWALMLTGFGMIGFALRRRSHKVAVRYAF